MPLLSFMTFGAVMLPSSSQAHVSSGSLVNYLASSGHGCASTCSLFRVLQGNLVFAAGFQPRQIPRSLQHNRRLWKLGALLRMPMWMLNSGAIPGRMS